MTNYLELFSVVLVGLFTTSSSMLGAAIGLYTSLSKKLIAGILAFAAGSLIGSLVIDLAYKGAIELHHKGFKLNEAWLFIASGFGLGAIIYLFSSLYLEKRGAAIRRPTQFKEFGLKLPSIIWSTSVNQKVIKCYWRQQVQKVRAWLLCLEIFWIPFRDVLLLDPDFMVLEICL